MSVDLHSCSAQAVVIIEDFFAALDRCVQEAEIPEEMRRDLHQFFMEAVRSPAQVIAASADPDLYVAVVADLLETTHQLASSAHEGSSCACELFIDWITIVPDVCQERCASRSVKTE